MQLDVLLVDVDPLPWRRGRVGRGEIAHAEENAWRPGDGSSSASNACRPVGRQAVITEDDNAARCEFARGAFLPPDHPLSTAGGTFHIHDITAVPQ
ncbi:hypothetical protein ACFYOG_36965 [Streptomyces sp. NPDC007818]|uniref:hypothetical protein n=1 Tax=Streptomyces sp. NPDC007818 TaxID=3364780 RepID=UPI0036741155